MKRRIATIVLVVLAMTGMAAGVAAAGESDNGNDMTHDSSGAFMTHD